MPQAINGSLPRVCTNNSFNKIDYLSICTHYMHKSTILIKKPLLVHFSVQQHGKLLVYEIQ